jgi:uncharacterized membrane protein
MIRVTLFSKSDCTLCDQAIEDLKALQEEIPHELIVVDIEKNEDLLAVYGERVPVVETGPYTVEAPFDRKKLMMTLGAARDRHERKQEDEGERYQKRVQRGRQLSTADRLTNWISRHYLAALNTLIFIYVGLPFLAPVLMNAGYPTLARPIYTVYGAVCHQFAFRSWFLFGEQAAYPRAAAGVEGLVPYGQATGESEADILAARNFIGNEQIGYKVAYCERDVAIYAAMLLFGLVFAASKRRLPPLPWYLWLLLGIAPIGLDGFSQLFSQIPGFPYLGYRESTPLLRTLTGGLFGFMTAWFGFPLLEESMQDTRRMLASKMARIGAEDSAPVGRK